MLKMLKFVSVLAVFVITSKHAAANDMVLQKVVSANVDPLDTSGRTLITINANVAGANALKMEGDNGDPVFPVGNCDGDCDSDDDCLDGLKCFQRDGNEEVPGCVGDQEAFYGKDFCYNPNSNGGEYNDEGEGETRHHGDHFRIKMWWQQGYMWQEEAIERKWCLQCRNECNNNVEIAVRECNSRNTNFEFVGSGQERQIKVVDKDLCIELIEEDYIQVKFARCSDSDRQKFRAGLGDFDGQKFEIETVARNGCLSQPHHPRDGELLRRQGCDGARFDTTSFFIKY
jgi:hypothetical protein